MLMAPSCSAPMRVRQRRHGKTHPRLTLSVFVKNPGREQIGKHTRCREDQVCIEAPMQKERTIETGLRTPEEQAAGPAHIPSELLGLATRQAETIFTYRYIEVLKFFYNAIGCPRGPFVPPRGPFVPFISAQVRQRHKLGDVAGRRSMSTSLRQRPPRPRSPPGRRMGPIGTPSGAASAT